MNDNGYGQPNPGFGNYQGQSNPAYVNYQGQPNPGYVNYQVQPNEGYVNYQVPNRSSLLEMKRENIKNHLNTNFPTIITCVYAFLFIAIGLSAIGLQAALISNMALNYQIGNGIWGGFFAIVNGLIKLNMGW